VTGGTLRGTTLLVPKTSATRPTTDRVREAIFSILYSANADLSRVLDLYAGTGALAIEALSRGADTADLVERAPSACAVIRKNLDRTGMSARARLYCGDVQGTLARLDRSYSVAFLDPPYADPQVAIVLATLGASGLIAVDGTIVLEHAHGRPPPAMIGALALQSDRRYGDTGVAFYQ